MKNRVIFHIDLDAFYTSVESAKNPELKGKPLVAGMYPKGGRSRGVVSTASYEARKYGVHSGQPMVIAERKLEGTDAVIFPVNMELYQKTSYEIIQMLEQYSKEYEQASIDEVYLDMTGKIKTIKEMKEVCVKIKKELMNTQGITCSIGIGPNKLISKIAANVNKPDGITIVKPSEVKKFLSKMSVRKIPGIGPKSEEALNKLGITIVSQLASTPVSKLEEAFGKKSSEWMHNASQGIDNEPVTQDYERKSVGSQYTLQKDSNRKSHLIKIISEVIESSLENLHVEGFKTYQTITLMIRFSNFETHTSAKTLKEPHSDKETAIKISSELLKPWLAEKRNVRLVGITFSKIK